MRRVLIAVMVLLVLAGIYRVTLSPSVGGTSTPSLLIPLYSYPNCQWNALMSLKDTYPVNILVIVNPSNGPGNQSDATYQQYIRDLEDSGIIVLGYVWTNYSSRPLNEVETDINNWISWYNVSGIFFDEVSTTQASESYYSTLVEYLKNKSTSYLAVGNPGTYNSSTVSDYLSIFDVLVIYDNPGYPTSWPANLNSSKLGALVYGVSKFNKAEFSSLTSKAQYVYVTNDDDNNPWDTLAYYIADEAASLANTQKINYILKIESTNTTSHSIAEHYPAFDLSGGTYNLTSQVFVQTWNSSGAGIYPIYIAANDSTNTTVSIYYYWGNGYNGVALYACYNYDCLDTDFNPTLGWLNLSIVVTQTSVKFYVNGLSVKNVTGLSLSSILRTDAGTWDDTAVYTMYIDNITETRGTTVIRENFDCNYDCYFTTHVGDVSVVNASAVAVPFFGALLPVLLVVGFLILMMK